jgi:hypothetical protein
MKVVTMSVTKKANARKRDSQRSAKKIMLLGLLSPPFTRPVILDEDTENVAFLSSDISKPP